MLFPTLIRRITQFAFVLLLVAFNSCDDRNNSVSSDPADDISPNEALVQAGVKYGSEDRQFLDIYRPASDNSTPIFFNAHANGGTTAVPNSLVQDLNAEGITLISWESHTSINSEETLEDGWADAELMLQWVMDNAETYNLDTANLISFKFFLVNKIKLKHSTQYIITTE